MQSGRVRKRDGVIGEGGEDSRRRARSSHRVSPKKHRHEGDERCKMSGLSAMDEINRSGFDEVSGRCGIPRLFIGFFVVMVCHPGAGEEPHAGGLSAKSPAPVTNEDFSALKASSPFLRSLDLSQSLILTGFARIKGDLFATLFDRETRQTHIVSRSSNEQGWRMVGVDGDQADLGTVTARIAVAGGEVFSVRFDENQLKPGEGKPGGGPNGTGGPGGTPGPPSSPSNYREGVSGDGFRGPPPPEIVDKLSRLTDEKREEVIRKIREIRDKNPELGSEDRQGIFRKMLDRALEERR